MPTNRPASPGFAGTSYTLDYNFASDLPLNVNPGQTITLTSTSPSPGVNQTFIDSKTTTADLIVPYAGTSVTSYKQLTVQLVTNVYRNSGGTLAFAYNLSVQDFATPAT